MKRGRILERRINKWETEFQWSTDKPECYDCGAGWAAIEDVRNRIMAYDKDGNVVLAADWLYCLIELH